jgi:hypothetical protein
MDDFGRPMLLPDQIGPEKDSSMSFLVVCHETSQPHRNQHQWEQPHALHPLFRLQPPEEPKDRWGQKLPHLLPRQRPLTLLQRRQF